MECTLRSGSTVRLPAQLPFAKAMELLLTGDLIDAATAVTGRLSSPADLPDLLAAGTGANPGLWLAKGDGAGHLATPTDIGAAGTAASNLVLNGGTLAGVDLFDPTLMILHTSPVVTGATPAAARPRAYLPGCRLPVAAAAMPRDLKLPVGNCDSSLTCNFFKPNEAASLGQSSSGDMPSPSVTGSTSSGNGSSSR